MKILFQSLVTFLLINLTFQQCANPGRPTGGPKDTIPPVLIYSSPVNGAINYDETEIVLEFSEYINADKLKQELIITPKTDIRYKSIVKRNRLIIKLDEKLDDSTTYNFNFANGVTDITEKNPAINLSLAFSTGPYIDSMGVRGKVEELLTQNPGKNYVVSLYPFSDTLNYFTDSPLYFTTASDSGQYKMDYIKKARYKIIAFNDDNGNFLLDPETESHGFLSDTISLDSISILPKIRTVLQNVKPITLINTRPTGRYVEIKFNKQVDEYELSPDSVSNNIIGENKDIIRLYKPEWINYKDSVQSYLTASDSLGNNLIDTIKYVFLESNRKPAGFSFSIPSTTELSDNPSLDISFNKPVKTFNKDQISFKVDSIFEYQPKIDFTWNKNRTSVTIHMLLQKDTLLNQIALATPADTVSTDSIPDNKKPGSRKRQLQLVLDQATFISVENDTTKSRSIQVNEPTQKSSGTLKLSTQTSYTAYTLQLLDTNNKVKYQSNPSDRMIFNSIKPGTYTIRILIDSNNDRHWSYGNLLMNSEPEEVYIYPEEISIRENWEVELSITF